MKIKGLFDKVGTPRYLTSMMESWFSDISRLKVELKVALYLSMILQVQKLGKEWIHRFSIERSAMGLQLH